MKINFFAQISKKSLDGIQKIKKEHKIEAEISKDVTLG